MAEETAATTHSTNCEKHNDIDNLQEQCNAITKSTRPCLLKPVVRIAGYLPVCHIHRAQAETHRLARCLAIEQTCGSRCNALCRWDSASDLNHRCDRHKHAALPCFFDRLPVELRIMIFEILIPDGPVPTELPDVQNPYADMAAIVRVNKEISSQVYTVMYQTASRKCAVYVEHGFAMHMAGQKFNLSLCSPSLPTMDWLPMYEMHRIGKFSHYDVCFHISVHNSNRSNIFHLMSAISKARKETTGHEPRGPEVHIKFHILPYGIHRNHPQYSNEWIEAIISGMRSVLAVAIAYQIELKWSVPIKVSAYPSDESVELLLTATNMEVTSGTITTGLQPVVSRILSGFETLRMYAWAQPSAAYVASLMTTWGRFNECFTTVRKLVELGYIVIDEYTGDPDLFICEFSIAAKGGLEGGRDSCSVSLLHHVHESRDVYIAHQQHNIRSLMNQHGAVVDDVGFPIPPCDVLYPTLRSRRLVEFVEDYKEKERGMTSRPWLERVEESRYRARASIEHFHRTHVYKPDYLELHIAHRQCAQAAARVRQGQTLLPFTRAEDKQL